MTVLETRENCEYSLTEIMYAAIADRYLYKSLI